jgi:hypothetical protein
VPKRYPKKHRGSSRTFGGFYPKFDVVWARMKAPDATKALVSQVFLHEAEILIDPKSVGSASEPGPAPHRMNPLSESGWYPSSPPSKCLGLCHATLRLVTRMLDLGRIMVPMSRRLTKLLDVSGHLGNVGYWSLHLACPWTKTLSAFERNRN